MACLVMCFIVIMISYGINWLSINEYAPIRHHLQQVNQELAAKYNNETLTLKTWQTAALEYPNTHISLVNLIDLEKQHAKQLTSLANGESFTESDEMSAYLKLTANQYLKITPLINTSIPLILAYKVLGLTAVFFGGLWLLYWFALTRSNLHSVTEKEHNLNPKHGQIDADSRDLARMQKDLLHGIAHELRSPLSRMQFALDMLPQTNVPAHKSLYRQIDNEVNSLNLMANELLNYARLEFMEKPLCFSEHPLDELIKTSLANVTSHYPKLHFIHDSCSCLLHCDGPLLIKALTNVLQNAGRVASQVVEISCWFSQGYCHIAVEDDGPGIPIEKVAQIFEPFTRLNPSRQRDSGGVGLGLAVTHSIISRHHGHIRVDESKRHGARFILSLPATKPSC